MISGLPTRPEKQNGGCTTTVGFEENSSLGKSKTTLHSRKRASKVVSVYENDFLPFSRLPVEATLTQLLQRLVSQSRYLQCHTWQYTYLSFNTRKRGHAILKKKLSSICNLLKSWLILLGTNPSVWHWGSLCPCSVCGSCETEFCRESWERVGRLSGKSNIWYAP